jgi:hypothetical protein
MARLHAAVITMGTHREGQGAPRCVGRDGAGGSLAIAKALSALSMGALAPEMAAPWPQHIKGVLPLS